MGTAATRSQVLQEHWKVQNRDEAGSGREVGRWRRVLGSTTDADIFVGGQQHRRVIAGHIHQDVRVVPSIDVPVTVPDTADEVNLKSQEDADKQENNKDQAGWIH